MKNARKNRLRRYLLYRLVLFFSHKWTAKASNTDWPGFSRTGSYLQPANALLCPLRSYSIGRDAGASVS